MCRLASTVSPCQADVHNSLCVYGCMHTHSGACSHPPSSTADCRAPPSQLQGQGQLQVGLQPIPVAAPRRQDGEIKQLALALQRQGIPAPQNVLQQGSQLHT